MSKIFAISQVSMWTHPDDQGIVPLSLVATLEIPSEELFPRDIDVVVSDADFEALEKDLLAFGYWSIPDEEDETRIYYHPARLPVEILVVEDSPDDFLLSPFPVPDYDVNLLAYGWDHETQAYALYNWMTGEKDVDEIIDHIRARVCCAIIDPDLGEDLGDEMEPRREKILKKGYKIL